MIVQQILLENTQNEIEDLIQMEQNIEIFHKEINNINK